MAVSSLSVCVINWNTADDLVNCLGRIYAEAANDPAGSEPVEVVVVDNASSDDSVARVASRFPQAKLIVEEQNGGYSRAANRGIAATCGDFVVVMNPDVALETGSLATLRDFLASHPEAGSCGPKLLNPDGSLQPSCRRFPTLATGLMRSTILGRLLRSNRATRDYLMTDFPHDRPAEVDWLSGACLALRRAALDQVGGFDEGFFMFCEDVDICLRLNQAGWKNFYVPAAAAVHRIASSTSQRMARMTYEWHRSMFRFYRKHYAATHSWPWRALAVTGIGTRCAVGVAKAWWHHLSGGRIAHKG